MTPCAVLRAVFSAIDRGEFDRARRGMTDDFVHRSVVDGRERMLSADQWLDALRPWDPAFSALDHGIECEESGPDACSGTFNMRARHTGVLEIPWRGVRLEPTGRRIALPAEPFRAITRGPLLARLEVEHPEGGGVAGVLTQLTG